MGAIAMTICSKCMAAIATWLKMAAMAMLKMAALDYMANAPTQKVEIYTATKTTEITSMPLK